MTRTSLKNMTDSEKAEYHLRRRLTEAYAKYGHNLCPMPEATDVEYMGQLEGMHRFSVHFSDGSDGLFEVKEFTKCAKVYWVS